MKNNNRSTIDAGYNAGYDGNLYSMVKTLAPDSEGQRAVQAARRLKRIRILTVSIVICLVAVVSAVFAIYSSTDWFKAKTPQPSDVDVVTPTRVTVVNRDAFAEAQRTGDFSALSGGADASLWVQPFLIGYRLIAEDDEIVKIAGGKIYGWAPGFTKVRVETSDGQFVDEFTVEVLDENGRLYYDVKFYAEQGASGDPLATLRVISGRAITQMQLSLPAFPAKAGYTPKFWTVDGKRFYDSDPITSDINVYVSWDPRIVSFLSSLDGNLDNAAYKADYEADISDYIDKTSGSGSFTYSAANLPSGLTLNPATGEISGRPQAAGTYVFTVTATDNAQTVQDRQNTKATKEFRLNVAKRVADIVFENKMFIYDGTYQTIAATITNIAEGDQGLVTPVINYINGTAQGVRNVGNYTAKVTALTGARADNYVLATQKTRDFSVYPRIAEISFTSGAVFTYDGTPKYAAARVVNLVPGDTCDVNISYDKDESGRVNVTGPEGIIATVDALSNPNYTLPNNAVTQRITIVPAVVFITVNVGQSKVYGSNDPLKFACSVSTDVEADLDAWETVAPLGIRRAAGENVGSYSYYFDASLIPASGQVADLLNNYTIEFRNPTDARFEITKRPVSLVGVVERGYNGGTDLGDAIYTFEAFNAVSGSGLKSPDTLVLAGSYENKAVGEGKTLVNLSLPAGLASNDNYELITKTYTNGKITVRNITSVSNFIGIGKEYDGTRAAQVDISEITFDGVLLGDRISINYNAEFDSANAGARSISITDIVITGEDKDNYRLLNNTATATATITQRQISAIIDITVAGKTYDRSINVPASNIDTSMAKFGKFVNGAFVNLLVSGDTLNVTSIAARYEDALYGLTKSVIITDIAIGGNDNYKLALECEFGEIYSSIYKKDLAISASDTSKVYNGQADIIVSNYAITGVISGDEVFFDGSYASVNVAETVALSFSLYGDDSANYRINTAPATGSINPRPVTVSGVFGKEYDATVNLVSALTINNLVAGDEADVAVTGAYSTANAGDVTLSLGLTGPKAANYSLTNASVPAVINKKAITISVEGLGLSKVYNGAPFSIAVSANMVSGLVPGGIYSLEGTVSTSDKYVADAKPVTIAGFKVFDNGADVTANYSFSGVSGTVAITPKEVTIEGDFDKTYDATKAVKVAGLTIAGKVASDDLYVSGEYALADFGTRAITFEIDGADKGNYTLVGSYSGYISKKTITISHSFTKVYDGNVYTVTVDREMVSGLISGRDYAITATLTSGDKNVVRNGNVGLPKPLTLQGGIVITDGGVDVTHNFEVIIDATVTINPAPLVLTQANLIADNKAYDGTTTATVSITGSPEGFISGDELTIEGVQANFATQYVGTNITVIVSGSNLVLSGADSVNYTLQYTGGGFTTKANITKRPITIVGNLDKTYDGNDNVDVSVLSVQNAVAADIGSIVFTGKYDSAGASPQFKTITFTPGNDIVSKNYIIPDTYSGKINKRLLNVIHDEQKPYDGTTAIAATLDPAGIVSGDEVFIVGGCGYFTDKYVAQNKAVSFTLGGGQKDNYYVQDSTAHIVRASITIDLGAASGKVYDATLYTGSITEGMLSGLASSDYLKSGIFESNSIHAGPVNLFCKNVAFADRDTDTDTTGCYIINIINNTAAIAKREIEILAGTVADKVYDGTKNVGVSLNYTVAGMAKEDESLLRVVVSGAELPKKDVGTYIIDVGFAFEGAHAGNYIATNVGAMVEVTVKVVKKPVQVIAAGGYTLTQALTKPYDKTDAVADLNKLGLQGTIAGDTVYIAAATYNSIDVNNNIAIGFTLDGADKDNYVIEAPETYTGAIVPKQITFIGSLVLQAKTYNGSADAEVTIDSVEFDGVELGDDVSIRIDGTPYFNSADVLYANSVTVSMALTGGSAGNYQLVNGTVYLEGTIDPKGIDVVIGGSLDKTYDGTSSLIVGVTLSGVEAGDNVGVTGAYYNNAGDITANADDNIVKFELTGDDKANYSLNNSSFAATIARRKITKITGLTASEKSYDQNTTASVSTANAFFEGLLFGDSLTIADFDANFESKNAGYWRVFVENIKLGGASVGNYELENEELVITLYSKINPRVITAVNGIKAADKDYDGNKFVDIDLGEVEFVGMLAGDSLSLAYDSAEFSDKNVGTSKTVYLYNCKLTGGHEQNYRLYTDTLTTTASIFSAKVTFTFVEPVTKVYDGNPMATVLPAMSGIAASDIGKIGVYGYYYSDPARTITTTDAGTGLFLKYFLSGDETVGNYYTENHDQQGSITPKAITITGITVIDKIYDKTTDAMAYVNTANAQINGKIGLDVINFSVISAEFDSVNAIEQNVAIKVTLDNDNYTCEDFVVRGRIVPKTLTATLNLNKLYDGTTDIIGTITLSDIEDGDDVNVTGAYEDKHFGDNKKINLDLGGYHAHNYCIAAPVVYGKISKLAITIDPGFENDTTTMVYNGEAYVLNIANIEGIADLLAQGDVLAGGTLTSFVDNIGKHGLLFGDWVTIKDAFNSSVTHNYDITLKNSYVEITKRPVAILPAPSVDPADAFSKPYDATSNINMDKLVLEAFDYTGGDSGVIAKDIGFVQFRGLYLDDESRPAVNVGGCVTIKFELYGSRAYNYYITNEVVEGAITARVITITQITTNKIWKYFDGNNEYNGSLVLNTHFSMTDAIEGETIEFTISNKRFNSIYAPVANFITVTFSLTSASVNQNYLLTGPGVTEPASVININFEAHIEKRSDPLKIEIIPSAGQSKICEMHPWLNVPMASFANNEIATFTISGNVNASIPSGINLNKTFKVYKLTRLLAGESVPAGSEEISLGGYTRWYYDPTAPLSEGPEGFVGEANSMYYIVPNAEYQPTNPGDPASQRALESVQVISTPSFIEIGTP
jgi:hypothetical protein